MGTIVVAGAGIGGLTAAIALRRAGAQVEVWEKAPALGETGAGITVQINAMRALEHLNVADAVAARGVALTSGQIRDAQGRILTQIPLEEYAEQLGAPCIALHRATLQQVLLAAAGPETVTTGRAVTSYERVGEQVLVRYDSGEQLADGLIGADGLFSAVRATMLDDGPPQFSGYTSWRGTLPQADDLPHALLFESWGPGRRFGSADLGPMLYWYATANTQPGGDDRPDRVKERLLTLYGDWHDPISEILTRTDPRDILRTDIRARAATSRWVDGPVALLGDAAHPMTPNLGQGGSQAIEDAVVLGDAVAKAETLEEAFASYNARRVRRANMFVDRSRQFGELGQWEGDTARWLRDTFLWLTPDAVGRLSAHDIYGFTL